MPADRYVVRFAKDDEGREVNHEAIISTEAVPYPPHQYAAMAVATQPDGTNHMVGIAIHPRSDATLEDYREAMAGMRDNVMLTAALNFPDTVELGLVWFTQVKASQMDEEMASDPHLIRGVLYRPCTDKELVDWLGEVDAMTGEEIDIIAFGGSDD